MRKIQLLALALVSVLALSALAVADAFAEQSKFLIDGNAIATTTAALTEGELLLADLAVPLAGTVAVLCSGMFVGEILAGGEDYLITGVTNLSGTPLTGLIGAGQVGDACTVETGTIFCGSTATVYPENLPWLIETLPLMAAGPEEFLFHLTEDTEEPKGLPAWEVVCASGAEDLCEGLLDGIGTNVAGGVQGVFTEAEEETLSQLGHCTQSGSNSGGVETEGPNVTSVTGKTLSISE